MRRSFLIVSLIILIDLLGIFYGYYYYTEQLSSTPPYLWLFVPDCPFYLMLFTIALVLVIFGFESKLFSYIAAVGMMKYGIWTILALLLYGNYFFSSQLFPLSSALFILHMGMFAEGPLLIPRKLDRLHVYVGLAWFLINDYIDYFYGYLDMAGRYVLGTHPILPSPDRMQLMMVFTFALTILLSLFAYRWSQKSTDWPARKEVEEVKGHFQRMRKNSGRRKRRR
jgi:uncharacterized membrane protein YpjA